MSKMVTQIRITNRISQKMHRGSLLLNKSFTTEAKPKNDSRLMAFLTGGFLNQYIKEILEFSLTSTTNKEIRKNHVHSILI